jgi:hypothetical protein
VDGVDGEVLERAAILHGVSFGLVAAEVVGRSR